MRVYKGFNKDMTCTQGSGTYQYKVGRKYVEEKAKTAQKGFHCVEEPIQVLDWYGKGCWCMCKAEGDINESGDGKIACTEITILKELTLEQIAAHEAIWIERHPERNTCTRVSREEGEPHDGINVVRGKNPKAHGKEGDILVLLKEEAESCKIERVFIVRVGEEGYKEGVKYNAFGEEEK